MKKLIQLLVIFSLLLFSFSCETDNTNKQDTSIKNMNDSLSYALGVNIGNDLKSQNVEINTALFAKGVDDGIKGEYDFTDTVIGEILSSFQAELNNQFQQDRANMIKQNKQDGDKFLSENKDREGVVSLPGGLQYKVIKEGQGVNPSPSDSVRIHYRAMFIDGTTFDQSYDRGITGIRLDNVIQGLTEGIQLMKPGAVYELYIPSDLAYGDEDFANVIPGGSTLIYRIELLEIVK